MFAYDYPVLGVFWTLFMFFLWFAWIMLLFRVFGDLFRSDIGGGAKALWALFVLVVPFLGVLAYLLVHGDSMTEREVTRARQSQEDFRSYVQDAAGAGGGPASELSSLNDLRQQGVLTDEEFEAQKAKILAG